MGVRVCMAATHGLCSGGEELCWCRVWCWTLVYPTLTTPTLALRCVAWWVLCIDGVVISIRVSGDGEFS
jgi:hypothetical protein